MRFLTRIFSLFRHCVLAVKWNFVSFEILVHVHASYVVYETFLSYLRNAVYW